MIKVVTMSKIEKQTDILVGVVAQSVCLEACQHIGSEKPYEYIDFLANKAESCYNKRENFRKKINGRNGRDWMYSFMRHWISAKIKEEMGVAAFKKLPADYSVGVNA